MAENNETWHREYGLCSLVRKALMYETDEAENGVDTVIKEDEDYSMNLLNSLFSKNQVYNWRSDREEDPFLNAGKLLNDTIMPDTVRESFQKSLESVSHARKHLLHNVEPSSPFPATSDIESYLDLYYQLLILIFKHMEDVQCNELETNGFLSMILDADMYFGADYSCATLYSPAVLDGLLHLYDCLEDYRVTIQEVSDKELQRSFQEVIISKMLRYFRWMIVREGELMHAAIPAHVSTSSKESNQWNLDIPIRRLREYNSYEGIGELRFLDKIFYEMDQKYTRRSDWKTKSVDNTDFVTPISNDLQVQEYRVAMIGDIHLEPMVYLCRILDRMVPERYCDSDGNPLKIHIFLTVFTYNLPQSAEYEKIIYNESGVKCKFVLYQSHLREREKLNAVLNENDVFFILDACDIYHKISVSPMEDRDLFWQNIAEDNYRLNYRRTDLRHDMVRKGNFTDLIQMYYALEYSGYLGWFHKDLNSSVIKYITKYNTLKNNLVRETENRYRSVYMYVSDMNAFTRMEMGDEHLIRVEQYNEKEMAIVRLSRYTDEKLQLGSQSGDKIIVFSIWQLIKHVAIRRLDQLGEYFGITDQNEIYHLKDLLIGVEYSEWPQMLRFYYQINGVFFANKPDIEDKLITYMNNMITPFFDTCPENMYYDYFLKSFSSFLYSDAKDVGDMLFLHLFANRHDKLGNPQIMGKRDDLDDFRKKQCKYSQKWYYQDIMQDYDTSSSVFAYKYIKLNQLKKKDPLLAEEIFSNIQKSCEWNSYQDSYLYGNCGEMIK